MRYVAIGAVVLSMAVIAAIIYLSTWETPTEPMDTFQTECFWNEGRVIVVNGVRECVGLYSRQTIATERLPLPLPPAR